MSTANLVSWLPFDTSTTDDLLGNTWTATGNPTVSDNALQLNGSSYLQKSGGITIGGQDFTIRGKANISTATGNYSRIFQLHKALNTAANAFSLYRYSNQAALRFDFGGTNYGSFAITFGEVHDFEFDYRHDAGKLYFFIDGALKTTLNTTLERITFDYCWLGRSNFTADGYFVGTIDEFQIYDGVALHTENFTPPTEDDYIADKLAIAGEAAFSFDVDVEAQIINDLTPFDYRVAFDGNTYGIIPAATVQALKQVTSYTFEIRFATNDTRTGSDALYCCALLSYNYNNLVASNNFTLSLEDGVPYVRTTYDSVFMRAANKLNDGTVHKLALVKSNTLLSLYVDGELVVSADGFDRNFVDTSRVFYLATTAGLSRFLQMDLYELRIWSTARTQDDLFTDIDGDEAGLLGWYTPAPLQPNILPDSTANARDIPLYGNPAVYRVYEMDYTFSADVETILSDILQRDFDVITDLANDVWYNANLVVQLPFDTSTTQDLKNNWWAASSGGTTEIFAAPEGSTHATALYYGGETDDARGRIYLNCQGMYLGGKDFIVTFDWWYGGAFPFSTNYPFGVWNDDYSSGICIGVAERFNANWQRMWLGAFGQVSAAKSFNYHEWHAVRLEYIHANSKLTLHMDDALFLELTVTIPRTFFTHVEIDRGTGGEFHGSGYMSDLKILGGEMAGDCQTEVIYLAVIHNGQAKLYPFRPYEVVLVPALAIYHDQRVWYNVLRELDDQFDRASDYYIVYGGKVRALSKG